MNYKKYIGMHLRKFNIDLSTDFWYHLGMYLRRIARTNKNGSITAYLQLAHNVWDVMSNCAKAKVSHSFGREDKIDWVALKRLVASISRVLSPEDAAQIQGQTKKGQGVEASSFFP